MSLEEEEEKNEADDVVGLKEKWRKKRGEKRQKPTNQQTNKHKRN